MVRHDPVSLMVQKLRTRREATLLKTDILYRISFVFYSVIEFKILTFSFLFSDRKIRQFNQNNLNNQISFKKLTRKRILTNFRTNRSSKAKIDWSKIFLKFRDDSNEVEHLKIRRFLYLKAMHSDLNYFCRFWFGRGPDPWENDLLTLQGGHLRIDTAGFWQNLQRD